MNHETSHEHPNLMRRNYSVQLPLTELEQMFSQQIVESKRPRELELTQRSTQIDAVSADEKGKDVNTAKSSKEPTNKTDGLIFEQILESLAHAKKTSITDAEHPDNLKTAEKFDSEKPLGKAQVQLHERDINSSAEEQIPTDKKLGHLKKVKKDEGKQVHVSQSRKTAPDTGKTKHTLAVQNKDTVHITADNKVSTKAVTVYPKATEADTPRLHKLVQSKRVQGPLWKDNKGSSSKKTSPSKTRETDAD